MACTLVDIVAVTPYSATDQVAIQKSITRFLTAISEIQGGPSRTLSLLTTKISNTLPNFPLPHSKDIAQHPEPMMAADGSGYTSSMPIQTWSRYPSTGGVHPFTEQTSVQMPLATSSMAQGYTGQGENMSAYATAHSATRYPDSVTRSNSDASSYDSPIISQHNSHILGHHTVHVPPSLGQHVEMEPQHLGVPPPAYNSTYDPQTYSMDPTIMYKR